MKSSEPEQPKPTPTPTPTHVAHLGAFSRKRGERELRVTLEEWPSAFGRYQIGIRNYQRDPASGVYETRSRSGCLIYRSEIQRLIAALKQAETIIDEQGEK